MNSTKLCSCQLITLILFLNAKLLSVTWLSLTQNPNISWKKTIFIYSKQDLYNSLQDLYNSLTTITNVLKQCLWKFTTIKIAIKHDQLTYTRIFNKYFTVSINRYTCKIWPELLKNTYFALLSYWQQSSLSQKLFHQVLLKPGSTNLLIHIVPEYNINDNHNYGHYSY